MSKHSKKFSKKKLTKSYKSEPSLLDVETKKLDWGKKKTKSESLPAQAPEVSTPAKQDKSRARMKSEPKSTAHRHVEQTKSLLQKDFMFEGDLITSESVIIEGVFVGSLVSQDESVEITIQSSGRFSGTLHTYTLWNYGFIEGSIDAQKTHLLKKSGACVDIKTKSLEVEEGALVSGNIQMEW